jgi:hypothetical protein
MSCIERAFFLEIFGNFWNFWKIIDLFFFIFGIFGIFWNFWKIIDFFFLKGWNFLEKYVKT